jgi:hypothetical protein
VAVSSLPRTIRRRLPGIHQVADRLEPVSGPAFRVYDWLAPVTARVPGPLVDHWPGVAAVAAETAVVILATSRLPRGLRILAGTTVALGIRHLELPLMDLFDELSDRHYKSAISPR